MITVHEQNECRLKLLLMELVVLVLRVVLLHYYYYYYYYYFIIVKWQYLAVEEISVLWVQSNSCWDCQSGNQNKAITSISISFEYNANSSMFYTRDVKWYPVIRLSVLKMIIGSFLANDNRIYLFLSFCLTFCESFITTTKMPCISLVYNCIWCNYCWLEDLLAD